MLVHCIQKCKYNLTAFNDGHKQEFKFKYNDLRIKEKER